LSAKGSQAQLLKNIIMLFQPGVSLLERGGRTIKTLFQNPFRDFQKTKKRHLQKGNFWVQVELWVKLGGCLLGSALCSAYRINIFNKAVKFKLYTIQLIKTTL
jgi:hypothetical protein